MKVIWLVVLILGVGVFILGVIRPDADAARTAGVLLGFCGVVGLFHGGDR